MGYSSQAIRWLLMGMRKETENEKIMPASVLIVDDQEIGRITLEGFLLPLGYELHFAASGQQALTMLVDFVPDVILLDVMMPGMSGFDVCQQIRADARWRDIPVILVTALDDRKSKIEGLEAGADDFISKPVDWTELRARVQTTVKLGRTRRQLQERTRFEWAVNQSSDGFIWLDETGRIVGDNPVARAWLGAGESAGRSLLERIGEKFILLTEITWTELVNAEQDVIFTLVRPETEYTMSQWLELTLKALPATGVGFGTWMVHLQDVTALQARMHQVVTVLAFLSHKLNSPLASLTAALEIMALQTGDDAMLQSLLATAFESVSSLESEIAQLLQLVEAFKGSSFDESDALTLENLDATVDFVLHRMGLQHDQFHYTRSLTRIPPFRRAVAQRILELLVENAIKFHPQGAPRVSVTLRDEGSDSIRIEVEDDGPGIPPEFWERVWQPLYQIDQVGAGTIAGMGIGLSLVANAVWRVGGRCWIESSDGGGACVCIVVPAVSM